MSDRARTIVAATMLAAACRPTTSIGSTAGDATTSGEPTTSSSGDATTDATSTAMDATTQLGMDGSSSESTTAGDDDDASGPDSDGPDSDGPDSNGPGPETGGEPMCMPAEFDSQCIACAKVHCCPEFGHCAEDFECGCTLGCLQYPGFPGPCMCAPTQQGADLFACLESECDFVCPPVG